MILLENEAFPPWYFLHSENLGTLARILMAQNQFPKDLLPRKKCNLLMQVFYSKIIGIDALCFR